MSDILQRILRQNWPFYSHRQLYDMVRTRATGASVLFETDQAWTEFTQLMDDSRRRIDGLLRMAGASWEGLAGDSMRGGVTPLAQWADDAGVAGQASGSGLRQVGDSFSYTANAMPEPVRPTVNSRYANVFSGQIDQDRQDRLAQEAKQRAVELMQRYSTNAHSAVSSLGVFVPPQEVTVGATPLTLSGGTAVQHGGNTIVTGPTDAGRAPEEVTGNPDAGQTPDPTPTVRGDATHEPTTVAGTPSPTPTAQIPPATTVTTTTAAAGPDRATAGGFPMGTGIPAGSRGTRQDGRLPGRPAPEPGAGPVGGGRQDGGAVRAPGAKIAVRAGAIGTGPTLTPATAVRREEDKEHVSPDYLRGYHDEFWDVGPQASPPVIGDDDPAPPRAAPEN